jgi:hypothetical protein
MPREDDNLVALYAGGFVDRLGIEACPAEISFCPSDKECRCLVDLVEAGIIEISMPSISAKFTTTGQGAALERTRLLPVPFINRL